MDEVITTDVDGFLVDIADIDAMADRLEAIATDSTLGRVGVAAAARAVADFDQSRQIRLFSEAYNALVSSRSSSAG
jgi:glycosyltransferase involved in cell wall biosynthesis